MAPARISTVTTPPAVTLRPRTEADLPALIDVLGRQQPSSRYPFRWPWPGGDVTEFLVRDGEEANWVAELDGRAVGHAAIVAISGDDALTQAWRRATGRASEGLACVSVLFVDVDLRGTGVGGLLLDAGVAWARERDRTPVLDVLDHGAAVEVYRHRGWREVGSDHPEWLPAGAPPMLAMVLPD